jgi:hypothetical protein
VKSAILAVWLRIAALVASVVTRELLRHSIESKTRPADTSLTRQIVGTDQLSLVLAPDGIDIALILQRRRVRFRRGFDVGPINVPVDPLDAVAIGHVDDEVF